jgi:hypothetical protein
MYMKKKGREIQMCAASSPGTPFKIKNPGVRLELLAADMMVDRGRACYTPQQWQFPGPDYKSKVSRGLQNKMQNKK